MRWQQQIPQITTNLWFYVGIFVLSALPHCYTPPQFAGHPCFPTDDCGPGLVCRGGVCAPPFEGIVSPPQEPIPSQEQVQDAGMDRFVPQETVPQKPEEWLLPNEPSPTEEAQLFE